MKKLNVKAALVLSLLAFSACDKGGGGSGNTQVVGVPGVTLRQYSSYPGQNCNVNGNNTYTCSENGRTMNPIGYDSLQSFCNILLNDQANGFVARMTRQAMHQEQCSGQGNAGGNGICGVGQVYQNGLCVNTGGTVNPGNGTIVNDPNVKTVQCQLAVKKGTTIGDTGLMNVPVIMNSKTGVNMFTFMNYSFQKKFLGIFSFSGTKYSNSEKLAKVKMYYTKEAGKAEMIKLEALGVDKDISASVTGFAGSETKLVIAPQNEYSDATSLEITCQAQGAVASDTVTYKAYRCTGTEKDGTNITKIDYASPYGDDIMNQSYDLSKTAKLHTEGSLATDAGTASFEQAGRYSSDPTISTKANITTPSAFKVSRLNYSLNVECKPIQ